MCEVCVRVDLFKAGRFKDLPGGTYLFNRLLVWVSGEDISLVPLNIDDPMDGKAHVAGNITAADAGFQANEDGDVVLNSERLYALSGEGDVLRIIVGKTFWLYRLSGDPLLISDIFTDVDTGNWVSGPVAWAVEKGITNGDGSDTIFSPDKVCNRGQIVTFLYRAYNN